VEPNQPVVAIIHRYLGLLNAGPSPEDMDALPYGHVESALSLTPYVVLADSKRIVSGPVLSDRGLSRAGGLLIDHNVPNYDIAANLSPFMTVPSRAMNIVSETGAQNAYRYGDRADAGTFTIAPAYDATSIFGGSGSDGIAQLHAAMPAANADVTVSNTSIEQRGRIDIDSSQTIADGSVDAILSLGRGNLAPSATDAVTQSFESARISAQVTVARRGYGGIVIDEGAYDVAFPG